MGFFDVGGAGRGKSQVETGGGDVFSGVEIEYQVLIIKNQVDEEDPLAFEETAELPWRDLAAAGDHGRRADVFDEDEALEAEGGDRASGREGIEADISGAGARDEEALEWLGEFLVGVGCAEFRGVELVDDIDGLGGDAEVGHEEVEGEELLFLEFCPRDQHIELNAEKYFVFDPEPGG